MSKISNDFPIPAEAQTADSDLYTAMQLIHAARNSMADGERMDGDAVQSVFVTLGVALEIIEPVLRFLTDGKFDDLEYAAARRTLILEELAA